MPCLGGPEPAKELNMTVPAQFPYSLTKQPPLEPVIGR
jgi:hypothetical protein